MLSLWRVGTPAPGRVRVGARGRAPPRGGWAPGPLGGPGVAEGPESPEGEAWRRWHEPRRPYLLVTRYSYTVKHTSRALFTFFGAAAGGGISTESDTVWLAFATVGRGDGGGCGGGGGSATDDSALLLRSSSLLAAQFSMNARVALSSCAHSTTARWDCFSTIVAA